MNFKIVRNDISEISADAIVLPANRKLLEGPGASSSIYKKAGRKQLQSACRQIYEKYQRKSKDIKSGTAVATLGFNLKADYIIHAIVPKWIDGKHGEYGSLSSAYLSSLNLADTLECQSIAFPLLSAGNNGFDIDLAFRIAKNSIEDYKATNALKKVYLVVYGHRVLDLLKRYGIEVEDSSEHSVCVKETTLRRLHRKMFDKERNVDLRTHYRELEQVDTYLENEIKQDCLINKGKNIASNSEREIFTMKFPIKGVTKKIHMMVGDICDIEDPIDILVCSAFQGNYVPVPGTLIGALYNKKRINVQKLARRPELDLRNMGCWLSGKTNTNFSRIMCVELLSLREKTDEEKTDKLLKSTFSTLRFLCEQASCEKIPMRSIVMPILGAGNQNIDMNYMAPVLFSQLRNILDSVEEMTDIYIYDMKLDKIKYFSEILSRIYHESKKQTPDVFISYSSKQADLAHQIYDAFVSRGVSCWIAPENISPGSDYIDDIATGIGTTKLTVLVLTPDAEKSRWVQKEVKTTIGSDHVLVPFQKDPYRISDKFHFILEGEQILEGWRYSGDIIAILADIVHEKIKKLC